MIFYGFVQKDITSRNWMPYICKTVKQYVAQNLIFENHDLRHNMKN